VERGPEGIKTEFNGFYPKEFLRIINNQGVGSCCSQNDVEGKEKAKGQVLRARF
jgi:hypothetical protein